MTALEMIVEYIEEIEAKGGTMPDFRDDPLPMQIAKLQDAWRK